MTTPALDDISVDDLLADLDKDLGNRSGQNKKKSSAPRKPQPWNEPVTFQQQWFPHSVTLVVRRQQCACGCEAESVEGLFITEQHPNGPMRDTRVDPKVGIPQAYVIKPRTIKQLLEQVPFCPACFNASVILTQPLPQEELHVPGL